MRKTFFCFQRGFALPLEIISMPCTLVYENNALLLLNGRRSVAIRGSIAAK